MTPKTECHHDKLEISSTGVHCPACDRLWHVPEIAQLKKHNGKLRDALAPFSCLGRNELTPGDFNRARRSLAQTSAECP